VAEGGGLLNRYTFKRRIEGSNPSVSASTKIILFRIKGLTLDGATTAPTAGSTQSRYTSGQGQYKCAPSREMAVLLR
jgi:hypothetical protein